MDKKEYIKSICIYFYKEIALIVSSIIFLFLLNNLNKELLTKFQVDDYINILMYDNKKPLYYFIIAVILGILATIDIVYRYRQVRYFEKNIEEIFLNLFAIFVMVVLIILLIYFINNPILRAIISLSMALIAFAYSSGS